MNRSISALCAASVAIATVAPQSFARPGTVVEQRALANVRRVVIHSVGELVITQAARDSLEVEAEPRLLPRILSTERDGTLYLEVAGPEVRTQLPIRYRLAVRNLDAVVARGSATVRAGLLRMRELALEVGGAGDVRIGTLVAERLHASVIAAGDLHVGGGAVGSQSIRVDGAGSYFGEALDCRDASVRLDGSGAVRLTATRELAVEITGSGDVVYHGSPHIRHWLVGAGRLLRAGQDAH